MINFKLTWSIIILVGVLFFIGGCVPSPDDPPPPPTPPTQNTPPDTTAPGIVILGNEGVKNNDTNVSIQPQDITVNFDENFTPTPTITVTDSANNSIKVSTPTPTPSAKAIVFQLTERLDYGTQYTVTIHDVTDDVGNTADHTFSFTTEQLTVDPNSIGSLITNNDAGKFNQLIVDPNDQKIYIAYVVDGNQLKLTSPETNVPESNADIGTIPTDGNATMAVTMIVSQDQHSTSILDIVYLQQNSGLHHARSSISASKINTWNWTTNLIKPVTTTLPTTMGLVRYDGDNTTSLHLSFFDEAASTLNYATDNATGWHSQIIDIASPAGDIAGQYSSIVLDDSQQPHIAYYYFTASNSNGDLKYAVTDDNGTSWQLTSLLSNGEKGQLPAITQLSGDNSTISSDDIFDITSYSTALINNTTTSSISTINSATGFTASQEREIEQWDTGNSTIISMKAASDGTLYAAYFSNSKKNNTDLNPELKLSVKSNNIWSPGILVDNISNLNGQSSPGYYVSIGIDDITGTVHFAYYDPIEHNLKYAKTR